jgi:hypothetical protein
MYLVVTFLATDLFYIGWSGQAYLDSFRYRHIHSVIHHCLCLCHYNQIIDYSDYLCFLIFYYFFLQLILLYISWSVGEAYINFSQWLMVNADGIQTCIHPQDSSPLYHRDIHTGSYIKGMKLCLFSPIIVISRLVGALIAKKGLFGSLLPKSAKFGI